MRGNRTKASYRRELAQKLTRSGRSVVASVAAAALVCSLLPAAAFTARAEEDASCSAKISFDFETKSSDKYEGEVIYAAKPSVTLRIETDGTLDKSATKVKAAIGGTLEVKKGWHKVSGKNDGIAVWEERVVVSDGVHNSLYVEAAVEESDKPLAAKVYGDKNTFKGGSLEKDTDETGGVFSVDTHSPVVGVKMSQAKVKTEKGIDYFPKGTSAQITVEDLSFDAEHSTVNGTRVDWTRASGTGYRASVEVPEGEASTLEIVAYDHAVNAYGDEGVVCKYGSSGTTDPNGNILSAPAFAIAGENGTAALQGGAKKAAPVPARLGAESPTEPGEPASDPASDPDPAPDPAPVSGVTMSVDSERKIVDGEGEDAVDFFNKSGGVTVTVYAQTDGSEGAPDAKVLLDGNQYPAAFAPAEASTADGAGGEEGSGESDGTGEGNEGGETGETGTTGTTQWKADVVIPNDAAGHTLCVKAINADKEEIEYSYGSEGIATDGSGNALTSPALGNDDVEPSVEINVENEDPDSGKNTDANGNRYYKGSEDKGTVTVTIRVQDPHFSFPENQDDQLNGSQDKTTAIYTEPSPANPAPTLVQGWTRSGSESGDKWECKVEFSEMKAAQSLKVVAYDKLGNGGAEEPGAATAELGPFYVDRTPPKFSIEITPDPARKTDEDGAKCDFYDQDVKAVITVEEGNFKAENMEVTTTGTMAQGWISNNSVHTLEIAFDSEREHSISVEGTDLAGNALVYDNNEAVGTYEYKFVVDKTDPKVTCTFKPTDAEAKGSKDGKPVFDAARTAEIVVDEKNFDKKLVEVNVTNGTKGEWSDSGDEHTLTVTFDTEGECSLKVTGEDWAKRKLLDYTAPNFIIDLNAPTVTIAVEQARRDTFKGNDYFNGYSNEADKTLSVKVTARDNNFDSTSSKVKLAGANAGEASSWSQESPGVWVCRASFKENTATATSSTLSLQLVDAAGNTAAYSYGADSATIKTSAGSRSESDGYSTIASGGTALKGSGFVLDLTAPKVSAAKGSDIPSAGYANKYRNQNGAYVFYNTKTSLRIVVTDNLGLYDVHLDSPSSTDADYPYTLENDEKKAGDLQREVTVKLKDGHEFDRDIKLVTVDISGNRRVWSIAPDGEVSDAIGSSASDTALYGDESDLYPSRVIQDTVKPSLKFSGVEAGKYYNTTQTVRLDVNELNFRYLRRYDANQKVITIDKEAGNAGRRKSSSTVAAEAFDATTAKQTPDGLDGKYFNETKFASDGHYSLSATVVDPATNTASTAQKEFTVDKTKPVVRVSFDNNNAQNGKYYAAGRTATVVVTEHNFSSSLIKIETSGSMGQWRSNGDEHTVTISYGSDGVYNLSISGKDLAGNEMAPYKAEEFVVDMTSPSVDFSGVVNEGAYNDAVTPSIIFSDEANFDSSGTSYTLTGSMNGTVSYAASTSNSANGQTVTYSDFTHEAGTDDIYTINASMTDLAGNSANGSITFSVNRYGSNFRVLEADEYTNNGGYLQQSRAVEVQEINVSGCDSERHGVTVTRGATAEELQLNRTEQQTGYTIESSQSSERSSRGWSSYVYRVAAGNFTQDGKYHVSVNSNDRADNDNTSTNYYDRGKDKEASAEVEFILDTTDPVVTNLNVGNGEYYDTESKNATFAVVENVGIDHVDVELDGSNVEVQQNEYGEYTLPVEAKAFTGRNLKISARDLAGRVGTGGANDFHVTTNIIELHLLWVILGALAVLALAGGVVYMAKRRKDDEGEAQDAA